MIAFNLSAGSVDNRHTERYFHGVKRISWNPEKNEWLKEHRGVCFEQVAEILQLKEELDGFNHPNQEKYPRQKIMIVNIQGYAYMVPRVDSDSEIFLKTIIPSRKATKKYLR
jgi:uncharacterized DUF497 family protein